MPNPRFPEIRNQAGNSALSEEERRAAAAVVAAPRVESQQTYVPMRLGAANSRARRDERERLAKAAEARIAAAATSTDKAKEEGEYAHENCCGEPHGHPRTDETKPMLNAGALRSSLTTSPTPPEQPERKPEDGADSLSQKPGVVRKAYHEPSPIGLDDENTSDREKRIRQAIIRLCRGANEQSAQLAHLIIKNALSGEAKYRSVKATSEKFRKTMDSAGLSLLESAGFEHRNSGGNATSLVLARDDPGLLILAKMLLEESNLVETK
jgi:hypothetical protein